MHSKALLHSSTQSTEQLIKAQMFHLRKSKSFENSIRNLLQAHSQPESNDAIASFLRPYKEPMMEVHIRRNEINSFIKSIGPVMIQAKHDKTLFIDLDETLVYTNPDTYLTVIRPHAQSLLRNLSEYYNIIIWTASEKEYAEQVVAKLLDPERKFITMVLSRSHCFKLSSGLYLKDLRIIDRLDLKKCAMIDNILVSFANDLDNGYLCGSYYGESCDDELLKISEFFESIRSEDNIQCQVNSIFHFKELITFFTI